MVMHTQTDKQILLNLHLHRQWLISAITTLCITTSVHVIKIKIGQTMSVFNKLTETNPKPKVIKLLLHIHVHVLIKL